MQKGIWRFFEQTVLAVSAKYLIVREMENPETMSNFQKLNILAISILDAILFNNSIIGYDGFLLPIY